MNFFVKPTTKNIVLGLLGIFFLFIIFANLLANKEGMESGETPEVTLPVVEKKKTSTKLEEDEEKQDSLEDDSY
jgi:hypothetical protein